MYFMMWHRSLGFDELVYGFHLLQEPSCLVVSILSLHMNYLSLISSGVLGSAVQIFVNKCIKQVMYKFQN